ncbi:hypothetical protein GCK32_017601 [Trichostrongylus colubriformis]|uniref:Uncharacterized protein n=1 Tax=Trichostrongylus colubriformis TaxID=6319 RepID=A0AAN8FYX3_TRICO
MVKFRSTRAFAKTPDWPQKSLGNCGKNWQKVRAESRLLKQSRPSQQGFRAVAGLKERHVSMENVPHQFAFLPDGSRFLQYSSSTLHIYFSEQILEKACQVGLCALVADGAHNLQPQVTEKMGQLYTIHGVMANSVDVPLLFAITMRLLGILLEGKYPSMSDLILTLQGCVTTARGALLSAERRRTQRKRLNKRDILRRRRIEREMTRFKLILHRDRAFLRTVTITTYCRRMSRFLTEKVV